MSDPKSKPSLALERGELRLSRAGHVATLAIDRPEKRNALSNELLGGIAHELGRLEADDGVRCVVLRGREEVFASGADLTTLRDGSAIDLYLGPRFRFWAKTREFKKPLVAAVSGICFGGGFELALSADVLVASKTARFGLPETGLGLIPAAGGTQRLPRLLGRALALEIILAGRVLDATEAESLGIVSRLADEGDWPEQAAAVAQRICERGPLAQRLAKEAVNASFDLSLEAGLDLERRTFAIALESDEAKDGIDAFLEKRDPRWRQR